MRAAGAQWQRRACGAHALLYDGPLQLLVRRQAANGFEGNEHSCVAKRG
jgi:hypothetical protein